MKKLIKKTCLYCEMVAECLYNEAYYCKYHVKGGVLSKVEDIIENYLYEYIKNEEVLEDIWEIIEEYEKGYIEDIENE